MTALDAKRMQTFFNEFIVTTYTFLNRFSAVSESKLINLERKLTRIEASIILIEEKLSDVSKVAGTEPPQQKPQAQSAADIQQPKTDNQITTDESIKSQITADEISTETPKDEPTTNSMIKISQSPLYRKYFMMLKVGVPMSAVRQKMAGEGIDVDLSNPDLLIEDTFINSEETEE